MSDTNPKQNSDLLGEKIVADWLGVSRSTLIRWRKKEQAPPHYKYPSGRVLYRASEVQEWIERHREGA